MYKNIYSNTTHYILKLKTIQTSIKVEKHEQEWEVGELINLL